LSNAAEHTDALRPEFVDRFAVIGPPEVCVQRLRALGDLGLDRLVITGASFRADPEAARTAQQLLEHELVNAIALISTVLNG